MHQLRRLSDAERARLRRRGKVFLVLGLVLFLASPVPFAVWSMTAGDQFLETGRMPFPGGFLLSGLMGFGGVILLFVGALHLRWGAMRALSEIAATETEGAVEHSSAAWGRGAGRGLKESGLLAGGLGGGAVVRVKCRACGFLESEGARFCSGCAKAM